MSKIQNLIDAHVAAPTEQNLNALLTFVAKPAVTQWSKNLAGAYLGTLTEGTPAKSSAKKATPKVKAEKSPEHVKAIAARKQAYEFSVSEFKAGRKITYRDACIKFGTLPAKEMKALANA